VDQQNPQRLMRAIEIVHLTQQPVAESRKKVVANRNFDMLWICLDLDRKILYDQINQRVDKMIDEGLVTEVASLKPYRHHPALKTVGYKEIFQFLEDEISLDTAIELIKRNTRRYAKRQLTWFRAKPIDHWMKPIEIETAISVVQEKLNQLV
jgi:tRNA dimethylallyltransferase